MTTKKSQLVVNRYVVTWAEFFPTAGIVTKHDSKQIDGHFGANWGSTKTYRKHFANKHRAIEWITAFNKPLDKTYKVRLFTDKQFSMAKFENGYKIPYTRKQWEEVYSIG